MSKFAITSDRVTSVLLVTHIVAMFGGFLLLGPAFDFPEILRAPASERFARYVENQSIIRPTYWVLTMTGITQILISVYLFHCVRVPSHVAASLALVFGTLTGLCQAFGFGRWVLLVPYLVAQAADPEQARMAALLEGAFNHYAGMLIGEHIANLCWGIWLASVCLAFLAGTSLNRSLAWFGLALAPLLLLLAAEQIGLSGDILDLLVDFGFPLLAVWHILLAVQLWRRNGQVACPPMGPAVWMGGAALALGMMVPALA